MDLRRDLFQQLVHEGGSCVPRLRDSPPGAATATWEEEQEQIAAWILRLPKPVGIMASNDDRGQQVLDACRRVNVLVPDEVAVIGVDNDEILCNLSSPPLSSVDINTQQVGYEAAALLERMMAGRPAPEQPLLLAPRGVVARESTDVLATEDRELAAAIRHIREHACEGLRLKDSCAVDQPVAPRAGAAHAETARPVSQGGDHARPTRTGQAAAHGDGPAGGGHRGEVRVRRAQVLQPGVPHQGGASAWGVSQKHEVGCFGRPAAGIGAKVASFLEKD